MEKSKQYDFDAVCKLWIGPKLIVFLFNPADVELILSSHVYIDKSAEYDFFKPCKPIYATLSAIDPDAYSNIIIGFHQFNLLFLFLCNISGLGDGLLISTGKIERLKIRFYGFVFMCVGLYYVSDSVYVRIGVGWYFGRTNGRSFGWSVFILCGFCVYGTRKYEMSERDFFYFYDPFAKIVVAVGVPLLPYDAKC